MISSTIITLGKQVVSPIYILNRALSTLNYRPIKSLVKEKLNLKINNPILLDHKSPKSTKVQGKKVIFNLTMPTNMRTKTRLRGSSMRETTLKKNMTPRFKPDQLGLQMDLEGELT